MSTLSPSQPSSLYVSLPTLLVRNVVPFATILALALFWPALLEIDRSHAFHVTLLWAAAVFLVIGILFTPYRIDLDTQGIAFVHLFPLWRKQSFPWSELGPFHEYEGWGSSRTPSTILQARILSGRGFWVMLLYRSRKVWLSENVAPSPGGAALGTDALFSLFESYGAKPRATLPPLP